MISPIKKYIIKKKIVEKKNVVINRPDNQQTSHPSVQTEVT